MRQILVLDLQDDPQASQDYRHWHRPGGPPAAVTRSLRESGIEAMEIWHAVDRLVMIMETGPVSIRPRRPREMRPIQTCRRGNG